MAVYLSAVCISLRLCELRSVRTTCTLRLQNNCERQMRFPPERSHLHTPPFSLLPSSFLNLKMVDVSSSRGLDPSLPVGIGAILLIQEPRESVRMTSVTVLRLDLASSGWSLTLFSCNDTWKTSRTAFYFLQKWTTVSSPYVLAIIVISEIFAHSTRPGLSTCLLLVSVQLVFSVK